MTTSIQSIDATDSALLVNGQEALRFRAGGLVSLNGGQLAGHRRRNINGDCRVALAGPNWPACASGTWFVDGYKWSGWPDAVVTASQNATDTPDHEFSQSILIQVTTADAVPAAGEVAGFEVFIEGFDVADLVGRDVTVGFWAVSTKTGVHCIALRNSGFDRAFVAEYTINQSNTWEKKSITIPGGLITAGSWNWTNGTGLRLFFAVACGTTFQTTPGSWQAGPFVATANQVNVLDTVGNIFGITGLQVEPGSVATPFEHRTYESELRHARRYNPCYISDGSTNYVGHGIGGAGGTSVQFYLPLFVEPRVTPTGISASGTFAANDSSAATAVTLAFIAANPEFALLSGTAASGMTQFRPYVLQMDSGSKIYFTGCRLP